MSSLLRDRRRQPTVPGSLPLPSPGLVFAAWTCSANTVEFLKMKMERWDVSWPNFAFPKNILYEIFWWILHFFCFFLFLWIRLCLLSHWMVVFLLIFRKNMCKAINSLSSLCSIVCLFALFPFVYLLLFIYSSLYLYTVKYTEYFVQSICDFSFLVSSFAFIKT